VILYQNADVAKRTVAGGLLDAERLMPIPVALSTTDEVTATLP
jgi:hypothetical protein